MNCRTLEYIVAVRECGSIKEAARRCHVTPGTISGQITRLENYLGLKIFEERVYPAALNPDAEKVYAVIRKAVENLRMIKQMALMQAVVE